MNDISHMEIHANAAPHTRRSLGKKGAGNEPLLRCDGKSGPDWRTADSGHRRGSYINLLGDAHGIFKFDAKVSDGAVDICVSEQQLIRSEISGFAVNLRRLGSAQRMGVVTAGFQPDCCHPIPYKPVELRFVGGRETG